MFEEIISTIENEDLKELALELIKTIPPYFYEVAASSTGKYHPSYALGEGGLYRHTLALCRIMNHLFEVSNYTSRDKDLMRIAGMMHDTRKSGDQEEYEINHYTNFDHPLQAALIVRAFKNKKWNNDEIETIASAIESHMGKWNTDKRSSAVLPLPKTKYQMIVHWCDYLASRKDIEIKFDNSESLPDINEYKLTFGKHAGKTLVQINQEAPDYISWMKGQDLKYPVNELIKKLD